MITRYILQGTSIKASMKVVFSFFFLSALVLVSQQQRYPLLNYELPLPPWNYEDRPTFRTIYDYLYARSLLQQYAIPTLGQQASGKSQLSDALSRNTGGLAADDSILQDPRFFFNFITTIGGTSSYNYLKTIYYITSATTVTTLVSTCVPAASFTTTSYKTACRKRREMMELLIDHRSILQDENETQGVMASAVASVEPSVVNPRNLDLSALGKDAILVPVEISGSKTEDYLIEHGYLSEAENLREKRFFIASSTITTYAFVTTSSTKTLSSLGTSLSCLPSQFLLC